MTQRSTPREPRTARSDPPAREAPPGSGVDRIGLLSLPPAIARMTLVASARAGIWGAGMGLQASRRLVAAAREGQDLGVLAHELRDDAVRSARTLLGLDGFEDALGRENGRVAEPDEPDEDPLPLRERGHALLARSAAIRDEPEVHPAFAAVLDQLVPDEARLLRLLATDGPQPVVDVFAAGPLGIGTREVARGISMIGGNAGCLHSELVELYIDNLERLGLVRHATDPLPDDGAYDVLQAQPAVAAAEEEAASGPTRARVEKGALKLTGFGRRFCEVCLPLEPSDPDA
jgi:hypothetical protein